MLLDLPEIEQKGDYDCGGTVYTCVCRYWESRQKRIHCDPLLGFHPHQLEPTLRRTGFKVQSGNMAVDDLKFHSSLYRPVICLIRHGNDGHYVVSAGVSRGKVYYMDPADGKIHSVKSSEFEQIWLDIDKSATVFSKFGLACWIE